VAAVFVPPDKGGVTPQATTIVVNSTTDVANAGDGLCTLREAITAANSDAASGAVAGECAAGSGTDTIDLSGQTGTINLTGALPDIISSLNITGPGSAQLTVRRNTGGDYRIFTILAGTVGISGVTITNGKALDGVAGTTGTGNNGFPGEGGGGIFNNGTLTLTGVVVTANSAGVGGPGNVSFSTLSGDGGNGGGIASSGLLTITNSSITANNSGAGGNHSGGVAGSRPGAGGAGGGIYTSESSAVTITNSTITGNHAGAGGTGTFATGAGGDGGGVRSVGSAIVTLTGVSVGNNVAGGNGGGISSFQTSVTLVVINSTINNNQSSLQGGGIASGFFLVVTGSTINSNSAQSFGGGIRVDMGKLTNVTVSGNSGNTGGGIATTNTTVMVNCTVTNNSSFDGVSHGVYAGNNAAVVRNNIFAGNSSGPDTEGNFASQGHNLIGNPTGGCCFSGSGDQFGSTGSPLNPQLASLANNGGLTMTHALLTTSPALDAGDNCVFDVTHCGDSNVQILTDQRGSGFSRKVDGPDADAIATVDIGAYETQVALANIPDTTINEDSQLVLGFDLGDGSTVTSVTATSNDTTLVPNDAAHLSAANTGSAGTVTINPATNQNGTTNITITVNRTVGGPDIKSFLLTVNPVNDVPLFSKGADQTVNEDAGAQTINNWATGISAGPADESGQVLTFQVTGNTNAGLFSAGPAISSSGTLTYTPAVNTSGSATITLNLKDNGGTTNGGSDTSATQTFTIAVNAVNDAPSFTKGADQTKNEDAGAQSVVNWATSISRGAADESGQSVTFTATNDNNALFSTQPAISSTGTLSYTPAANGNGTATVTVTLKDNGGTANGGNDTSPPQTFTITVTAVNDAPSFTKGGNQTVNEDAGAQTVNNWATSISAGPNESGQALTFQVTGNTNAALFSAGPAISSTGTLTYTPAVNANGSATITINLKDDGGTANGGVDTSASQTFTITVNAVNDAPSFTKGADQTVNNNAGAQSVPNWATNISAGPANESAQTLAFQISQISNTALFAAAPAVSSNGTLTYTPAANAAGTATMNVRVQDNGGIANGGVDTSAIQTFSITITAVGGTISFSTTTYNTTESSGFTTVTVKRTGDLSRAVTIDYATSGDAPYQCSGITGIALPKCDFTTAIGTLNFAAGEDTKVVTILINQDSFVEGSEQFDVTLSNPTNNAALGPGLSREAAVIIADDATEPAPPANVIDDAGTFVRMHYHDFLNREADQSGLNFWTGQMTNCGNSDVTVCRVNVSGAFFLSIEFQQTGYLVERMYRTAYGQATATSGLGGSHPVLVPIVRANEFLTDTQRIGRGVVVLQPGWETVLENNKQAYPLEFVQTTRFITALPTSRTPTQFVDQLNQNAGMVLSPSERTAAINTFGIAADTTNVNARAQVLRQIAEDQDLYNAEFSRAFVLAEFIGYLRRNPNDAPESTLDYTGYEFWLNKMTENGGDYIKAEMVKAFISSSEYRQRFGP
jgi:CSLREA domain-containing protein